MKNIKSSKYTQLMKTAQVSGDNLMQEFGVYYTRDPQQAKQMGFIKVSFFRQKVGGQGGDRDSIFVRSVANAKLLVDGWNRKLPKVWKYHLTGYVE